jgi:hypothetical protein
MIVRRLNLIGVLVVGFISAKAYLVTSGLVSAECRAFCEKDGRLAVIEGPLLVHYNQPVWD